MLIKRFIEERKIANERESIIIKNLIFVSFLLVTGLGFARDYSGLFRMKLNFRGVTD